MGAAPTLCHATRMDEDRGRQCITQYRDTWGQLQAVAHYAGALPRRVVPEDLARQLAECGESQPADVGELLAVRDWLREVAAAAERCRRQTSRPTLPTRRPPLTVRYRVNEGGRALRP